jgi:hypothetical protein
MFICRYWWKILKHPVIFCIKISGSKHQLLVNIMSQFKRNISVTSDLPLPIEGNWERIVFDSIDLMVPSDLMLRELILSPTNNPLWLFYLLREHQQSEIAQVQAIRNAEKIDDSNMEQIQLAENIDTSQWDNKIQAIFSLRKYGLPQKHVSEKSRETIELFSNKVVSTIDWELSNPSPVDKVISDFCNEKGIEVELLQYHKSVVDYCLRILPHPLNFVSNIDRNSEWSVFIADKLPLMRSDGKVPLPSDVDLAVYRERNVEAERRASSLFSDYRGSRNVINEFVLLVKEERPEIFRERFEINNSTVTSNRSYRRSKKPTEKDLLLCRCEFCYEFRTMVRKRGVSPAWHCHRTKCKKQYDNWKNDLNKRDIYLEVLFKQKEMYLETLFQQGL